MQSGLPGAGAQLECATWRTLFDVRTRDGFGRRVPKGIRYRDGRPMDQSPRSKTARRTQHDDEKRVPRLRTGTNLRSFEQHGSLLGGKGLNASIEQTSSAILSSR